MLLPIQQLRTYSTPCYVYDTGLLCRTLSVLKCAADYPGFCVHYAVKANTHPALLQIIAAEGLGADTVSGGEIEAALSAGFPAEKIMFAGVGKSDDEIRLALMSGIGCLNVESREELIVIEEIASELKIVAPVSIRVNPEIDAHTHHYITTGLAENKFGVAMQMLDPIVDHCVESTWLDFKGLHFHIGSQIETMRPFEILSERILHIQQKLNERGIRLPMINVGGGLGVDYENPIGNPIPDFNAYFDVFHRYLPLHPGQQLHFELGRAIVAQCGALVSKVLYVKQGVAKKFVILDAGMTELIRPALYQAHHKIVNISSPSGVEERYTVVGPVCESADVFADDIMLPHTRRGDLLAILSAGAYGEVMSSNYNSRPSAHTYLI